MSSLSHSCIATNGSFSLRQILFPEVSRKLQKSPPTTFHKYFDLQKELSKRSNYEFQPKSLADLCECKCMYVPSIQYTKHSLHVHMYMYTICIDLLYMYVQVICTFPLYMCVHCPLYVYIFHYNVLYTIYVHSMTCVFYGLDLGVDHPSGGEVSAGRDEIHIMAKVVQKMLVQGTCVYMSLLYIPCLP